MDLHALQAQTQFHMHQRITAMVNRYEIFADDGGGNPGHLVAFAEQKRMKLKEQVTLYTDESRRQVLAGFQARKVLDVGGGYDVTDHNGTPIGLFRKDFAKSLARSTWHIQQPNLPAEITGQERSKGVAILRRVWDFIPVVGNIPFFITYHFDFVLEGRRVASVERKATLRDRYQIRFDEAALDRRLVLAQAVALDALQRR